MAGSAPSSPSGVEANQLNVAEVLLALGNSTVRRARLFGRLASQVVSGEKSALPAAVELLDGNESDLEELTLRWRLAGLRWPIVILILLGFAAGFNAGRRSR